MSSGVRHILFRSLAVLCHARPALLPGTDATRDQGGRRWMEMNSKCMEDKRREWAMLRSFHSRFGILVHEQQPDETEQHPLAMFEIQGKPGTVPDSQSQAKERKGKAVLTKKRGVPNWTKRVIDGQSVGNPNEEESIVPRPAQGLLHCPTCMHATAACD